MEGDGQSEWHSIRPWSPRLALLVREITSVSATFILSSSLSDPSNGGSSSSGIPLPSDPSLPSLDIVINESEQALSDEESTDSEEVGGVSARRELIISNALARGLSVNVNGSPWQRVLIRIDDKADEAVIIIYGLMPGRQYDIDLGLVQGGQGGVNLRRQVITEDSDRSPADDHDPSATYDTPPESNTPSQPSATPSHLPLPTPPQSPSPTSHPSSHISVEDRVAQLQHTLTILHGERATLTTSLKTARRDAQKADAVLRSQIDTLRRASEKNTAAENRARQKVLALQEAVKRAQTATEEMEELVKEVENALPALQRERREKERVYNSVFVEAEKTRKEMEREQENVRKVERGEADLGALGNRLERINAKREKLEGEGGTIQDLEEELREVQREIERAEMDPYGFSAGGSMETGVIDTYPYAGPGVFPSYDGMDDTDLLNEEGDGWDPRFSYVPPRARIHSQPQAPPPGLVLGPIGRPPPAPIQRPSSSHVLVPTLPSNAAATSTSNSNLSFSSSTGKRSNRNSLDPPFVYQPSSQTSAAPPLPPSQPLLPSHTALKSPQQQRVLPTSSTSSSSLSPSLPVSGTGTMLSSKAPPFEPGRGMVQAARAAASTSPVQVSKGGTGGRRRSNSKRVKGGGGGSGDGHSGLK